MVKNRPAMQETREMRVQSLGWEGPLVKVVAAHSRIRAGETPWTRGPQPEGCKGVRHGRASEEQEQQAVQQLKKEVASHCLSLRVRVCELGRKWGNESSVS